MWFVLYVLNLPAFIQFEKVRLFDCEHVCLVPRLRAQLILQPGHDLWEIRSRANTLKVEDCAIPKLRVRTGKQPGRDVEAQVAADAEDLGQAEADPGHKDLVQVQVEDERVRVDASLGRQQEF